MSSVMSLSCTVFHQVTQHTTALTANVAAAMRMTGVTLSPRSTQIPAIVSDQRVQAPTVMIIDAMRIRDTNAPHTGASE